MAKEILTKDQKRVLALFSANPYLVRNYYFSGGTPLAAFYLKHRFSEDLDFFTEKQEVHLPSIEKFMHELKEKLGVKRVDYHQYYGLHSFFLHFKSSELKIDFNYYPFPRIEKGIKYNKIEVDSIYDIAVNKIHTIFTKARARDFIDIFYIIKQKKYQIPDLIKQAKAKFDWHIDRLQIAKQLYKASEISDYPRMIQKIDHREWKSFFINESKKLGKDILK